MNITLNINQYYPRCIYFGEPVQNTIMENSRFVKLIYSNELVIMNVIYFEIPLNITHKATYFRRNKYFFDINKDISQETITYAQDIEYTILKKYMDNRKSIFSKEYNSLVPPKHMKLMVFDSFQHGCIKSESGSEFVNSEEISNIQPPQTQQDSTGSTVSTTISSSNNSNVISHPSFHLNKQRNMHHTFRGDDALVKGKTSIMDGASNVNADDPSAFTSWHVILKVSGVWESLTEYGLTYKFIITPKYKDTTR